MIPDGIGESSLVDKVGFSNKVDIEREETVLILMFSMFSVIFLSLL